jgi:hypothetical protein
MLSFFERHQKMKAKPLILISRTASARAANSNDPKLMSARRSLPSVTALTTYGHDDVTSSKSLLRNPVLNALFRFASVPKIRGRKASQLAASDPGSNTVLVTHPVEGNPTKAMTQRKHHLFCLLTNCKDHPPGGFPSFYFFYIIIYNRPSFSW